MSRLPAAILCSLALAASGTIAACGSSDDGTADKSTSTPAAEPSASAAEPTAGAAKSGVVEVSMKNIKFIPDHITVKVGQKIHWTNDDDIVHNVTDQGGSFASDNINGGGTFDYTPKKAGTINYVCTIHSGQNGTITVTK